MNKYNICRISFLFVAVIVAALFDALHAKRFNLWLRYIYSYNNKQYRYKNETFIVSSRMENGLKYGCVFLFVKVKQQQQIRTIRIESQPHSRFSYPDICGTIHISSTIITMKYSLK